MKTLAGIFFHLFFCLSMNVQAGESYILPAYSIDYDSDRDPFNDLVLAMEAAEQHDRLVLLIVGGYWCSWCHTLDKFIENDAQFSRSFYDTFEVVKVYFGSKNRNQRFLSKFPKILAYPHFFIMNYDFQLLASQSTGSLEKNKRHLFSRAGYSEEGMREFLDRWMDYLQKPQLETEEYNF